MAEDLQRFYMEILNVRVNALEAARKAVEGLSAKKSKDDDEIRETVRIAVRRSFRKSLNKKPLTTVHLVRV